MQRQIAAKKRSKSRSDPLTCPHHAMTIDSKQIRLTAALRQIQGVGPVTARDALARLSGCPQTGEELAIALDAVRDQMKRPINATERDLMAAFDDADRMMEQCGEAGISIAIATSPAFPPSVWSIPRAPLMLFYRGRNADAASQVGVAVIGTREPSHFGAESGRRIAMICAKRHLTVVSGLAVGCDAAAHQGAIEGGGLTIAVLAHGLHTVYPKQNRRLAEEILETGGMLVSEYPIGVELRANQLVERDRLQAALSRGLIVIETDIEGGTMHTVKFALEQGRAVACINHKPDMRDAPKSRGNQKLIMDRTAVPLDSKEEVGAYLDRLSAPAVETSTEPIPPAAAVQQEFDFGEPTAG